MRLWILPLLLACLLAACFEGPTLPTVDRPILLVRATTPADSATLIYGPEPLDFGISFNRAAEPGEVTLLLVPSPLSSGEIVHSPGGREMGWLDVQLSPDPPAYRLLIDGPAIPLPHMVFFHNFDEVGIVGRIGGELSTASRTLSADGAILFALESQPDEEPPPEVLSYLGLPVTAIQLGLENPTLGTVPYVLRDLEPHHFYVVLAILDTSDDGRYELERDWWGVHHPRGDPFPEAIQAGVDFDIRTDVDITLEQPRPPGF